MSVNGGNSLTNSGGGAGGRIGVHVDFQNNYGGIVAFKIIYRDMHFPQK